jgi:3',5'-cyclic-nucleotide phosphodiesterase
MDCRLACTSYFSWQSWANFGDAGEQPQLKKYHYVVMEPGNEITANATKIGVTAFSLSHGNPYESTAFLLHNGDDYCLYFGDTGADSVEHSSKLHQVWSAISPIIRSGHLKAMLIEVSFPDEQPVKSLFGHLTPALLNQELRNLAALTGEAALHGLPVVITHRKPNGDQEERIQKQLLAGNPLRVNFIFPEQARRLDF